MNIASITTIIVLGLTVLGNVIVLVWHTAVVRTTINVQGDLIEKLTKTQHRLVRITSNQDSRISVLESQQSGRAQ